MGSNHLHSQKDKRRSFTKRISHKDSLLERRGRGGEREGERERKTEGGREGEGERDMRKPQDNLECCDFWSSGAIHTFFLLSECFCLFVFLCETGSLFGIELANLAMLADQEAPRIYPSASSALDLQRCVSMLGFLYMGSG